MGALLQPQVFATKIPADVHQLDGVQSAAPGPRRAGAVRRLAVKGELGRYQAGARDPVAGAHCRADVGREHDVHALEQPGVDHVGSRGDELLGDAGDHLDRAFEAVLLHQALGRDRGDDVDRGGAVVSLAVARAVLDQRVPVGDAGLLGGLRKTVDVTHDADHRLAAAPGRNVAGRHAGAAGLDIEPLLGQDPGDVLHRPELLEAELAERENRVDHLLRQLLHRRDHLPGLYLELLGGGTLMCGDGERRGDQRRERQIEGERAALRHVRLLSRR